jgi:hypothetical protein
MTKQTHIHKDFSGPPQWSDVQKVLHLIAIFATNIKIKNKKSREELLPYFPWM